MNVELPRRTYISSWDNVKNFFTAASPVPSSSLLTPVFQKGTETLTFCQREVGVPCWSPDPESCGFKNINKDELFFNGSWEILPGQPGNAAGEGWPARFLYERWELGNGKWEMAHRPVTMDHRKV